MCWSVLQCIAVFRNVLQYVAVAHQRGVYAPRQQDLLMPGVSVIACVSATSTSSWHVVRNEPRTMLAVLVSFTVKGLAPRIVSRVISLVTDILGRKTQCMAGSNILRYFMFTGNTVGSTNQSGIKLINCQWLSKPYHKNLIFQCKVEVIFDFCLNSLVSCCTDRGFIFFRLIWICLDYHKHPTLPDD